MEPTTASSFSATIVKQNLADQYIQNWFNQIENSSRGEFYGIFKHEFNLEKYLLKLLPHKRNMITKFRCNNIKLSIETGRFVEYSQRRTYLSSVQCWFRYWISFFIWMYLCWCKGLDVNLFLFIILDMQTCTKWKACYLCVMLRFWKNCHYLYLNCKMFCNYILRLYYFRLVISVIM